jgi:hypothetical protein
VVKNPPKVSKNSPTILINLSIFKYIYNIIYSLNFIFVLKFIVGRGLLRRGKLRRGKLRRGKLRRGKLRRGKLRRGKLRRGFGF